MKHWFCKTFINELKKKLKINTHRADEVNSSVTKDNLSQNDKREEFSAILKLCKLN